MTVGMRSNRQKRRKYLAIPMAIAICLSGCGHKGVENKYRVEIASYDREGYEFYEVSDDDVDQVIKLKLISDETKAVIYRAAEDEMVVEKFDFSVGDVVTAGQVIMTFENKQIDEKLEQYSAELEENRLLLDHYRKLYDMGSELCTEDDIRLLQEDVNVCEAYISQLNAQKEAYTIVAEKRGVISKISDIAAYGKVDKGNELFTVIYGEGMYTSETSDDYDYVVDDIYEATFGNEVFNMKLVSVEKAETGNKRKLTFEYQAVNGEIPTQPGLEMELHKQIIKGAVYVPIDALIDYEGKQYVIVLNEEGYGCKREVEVGIVVENNAIIEKGLEKGEKVVLK